MRIDDGNRLVKKDDSYTFNYSLIKIGQNGEDYTKVREFSITVKYDNTEEYYSGYTWIENLEYGTYTIEETSHTEIQGYDYNRSFYPNAVTVSSDFDETFTNPPEIQVYGAYVFQRCCDITVSKTVEGNAASADDEFIFQIEYNDDLSTKPQSLDDENAISVFATANNYEGDNSNDKIIDSEVIDYDKHRIRITFKLKHGESITFDDVLKDTTFSVVEIDDCGYDSTTVNGNSGNNIEGSTGQLGAVINFVNYKDDEKTTNGFTVEKKWSDGNDKHAADSVTVQLYRNGQPYNYSLFGKLIDDGKAVLNAGNNWQHTWDGLEPGYKWTVAELNVPNGYVCTVNYYGSTAVITNTVSAVNLPQTGDGEMQYIGAMLVLAAMAIAIIIAGKERD